MKKKTYLIIFILFFFSGVNSYSQNIAYANLDTIIKTSEVGKKIIAYFSDENKKIVETIKKEETKLREKEKKLISKKNLLTADDYLNETNILKKEIQEFNNKNQDLLKRLNSDKERVSKAFLIEINKVIKEYAEKNQIDMILSSNQMLIGKSNLDLTNNILENVNNNIRNFKITK